MNIVKSLRGRSVAAALGTLAALAAAAIVLLAHSASAPADVNFNNLDCRGHIEKAPDSPDDPGATQVLYSIACNGPITGYAIQTNNEVESIETEVFGVDKNGAPYPSDSFSCNGDLPGYGINCVGFAGFLDNTKLTFDTTQKSYVTMKGHFSINTDICAEPRLDPLLTVVTAGKNAAGTVTQAISGPFDLGRPRHSGCTPTKFSGKTRIPNQGANTDAANTDIG